MGTSMYMLMVSMFGKEIDSLVWCNIYNIMFERRDSTLSPIHDILALHKSLTHGKNLLTHHEANVMHPSKVNTRGFIEP